MGAWKHRQRKVWAPRNAAKRERAAKIIKLRRAKKSYQKIADVFGLTRERVRQILRDNAPSLTGHLDD